MRLELVPKIGEWNIAADLPDIDDSGNVVFRHFATSGALSLGFEVNATLEYSSFLTRFWHAQDLSSTGFTNAFAQRVTSRRTGVDLLIKGPSMRLFSTKWHLGFLLFGYYEDLVFQGHDTGENALVPLPEGGHGAPFTIDESTAYAGGGLTLDW